MIPNPRRDMLLRGPARIINLDVPMPPSVNKLYQRRRGGGVALTAHALEYQRRVSQIVADNILQLQGFPIDIETVYAVDLTLFFTGIENAGWYQMKNGQRQAKTRYKRIDVDNRVKFLQDCVIKAIGIPDDSQVFVGTQRKALGKQEHAVIKVMVTELSEFLKEG